MYFDLRWADTVIAALGNATYSKMVKNGETTLSPRQKLVKEMVEKKRKLQDQSEKQRNVKNDIKSKLDKGEKKNDGAIRKKREDTLKKHAQPFMF